MTNRMKSKIWLHFSEIDANKRVACLYCSKHLSVMNKSTYNLIRHMSSKHPSKQIIRQSPSRPHQRLSTSSRSHNRSQKHRTNTLPRSYSQSQLERTSETDEDKKNIDMNVSEISEDVPPPPETPVSGCSQSLADDRLNQTQQIEKLSNETCDPQKQKVIDRQLILMIAKEFHPFSIVEDVEFRQLIKLLNPGYKLPTRKIVSQILIPEMYNETRVVVKNRLKHAISVCITTNGWTSRNGFVCTTAHYVVEQGDEMQLASDLLGCVQLTERHTAENIYKKLCIMFSEWEIDQKVAVVVTEDAANIKAAVRLGGWQHWNCFAHSLNLIMQAGLREIKNILNKIRIIVRFFKSSSHASAVLKEAQDNLNLPPLKLKIDVAMKWNSTYDMIRRILTIKNAVIATITRLNSTSLASDEKFETSNLLNDEEWNVAEEAIKVLEIFDVIHTDVNTEKKVNISCVMLYCRQMRRNLHSFDVESLKYDTKNLLVRLLSEVDYHFFSEGNNIDDDELISQCTILDPRFKKLGFKNDSHYHKTVQNLYTEVDNTTQIIGNTDSENIAIGTESKPTAFRSFSSNKVDESLWKSFDLEVQQCLRPDNSRASAVVEVGRYLSEPLLPRKDNCGVNTDPLIWWQQRRHVFPRLYQIANTKLCTPAISVPCDKIVSRAGQIASEKRGNLKTGKLSEVIFLSHNLGKINL